MDEPRALRFVAGIVDGLVPQSMRRRVIETGVLATVAGVATARFAPWQLAALSGWDLAVAVLLLRIWFTIARFDGEQTETYAVAEDNSPTSADTLLIAASLASLGGAGFALTKAHESDVPLHLTLTLATIVAIALSWTLVHTVFTLRYAHEFYAPPAGGVDFHGHLQPDYRDFAYLSFTIGMTFQVSDTDVTDHEIRRTVLRHSLLAYLFGAIIVAVLVNVIGGLLS